MIQAEANFNVENYPSLNSEVTESTLKHVVAQIKSKHKHVSLESDVAMETPTASTLCVCFNNDSAIF